MITKKHTYLIYHMFFCAFVFLLPFEGHISAIPNILLGILGILSLNLLNKNEWLHFIKRDRVYLSFIVLISIIFIVAVIKKTWSEDLFVLKKLCLPLIILPLSLPIKRTTTIKIIFISSVFLAMLISTYNILGYITSNAEFSFSKGNFINELLVSERLYLGFVCVISLALSLDFYRSYKFKKDIGYLMLLNSFLIIVFLFFIVARIAIISALLVLIYFIIRHFKTKQILLFSLLGFCFLAVFFSINRNLTKRFFHLDDKLSETFFEKIKTHEPRYEIWKCCGENLSLDQTFFIGHGFARTKELLVSCYANNIKITKRKEWFIGSNFNTHNQFLDLLLGSGIIALIIVLVCFYFLLVSGNYSLLTISLLSILVLIMLVENIFHRQIGCYLFSLVIIVVRNRT